jgi:hypothetical protein
VRTNSNAPRVAPLAIASQQRYVAKDSVFRTEIEVTFETGRAKTGGRKRGVANKRTVQRKADVVRSGLNPVDYMLGIVRNEKLDLPTRLDAAKAVAPYTNPRLSQIDASVVSKSVVTVVLTDEQRREQARRAIAEAFAERPLTIEHEPRVIAGRDVAKDVEAKAESE